MATSRRPSPILVLSDTVDMCTDEPEPGHGWNKMECASKRSYGCGQHATEAAEGLTLYARLGDGPLLTSSLAIRMTDEAFRRFDSEIQLTCPLKDDDTLAGGQTMAAGTVQVADEQGLTVIFLDFRRQFCSHLAYYLVYDNATASLSLIQYAPDRFEAVCMTKPVVKRNGSGDFELFVMALDELSPAPCKVLCACTPETRANPAASGGNGPWQTKKPIQIQHEDIQEPFIADVAFSFQSKYGIWADLS
ncbi:hypothetical protein HU200_025526 [Digitaria exilis]|uniref:Uncharacterized protein n=1 Tax=Digitaria exilis TaxID=1010633 RepID=A0A835EV43_9POAL|nr:hypothetical protein HU200_025526 [Digitaria exilis]CAB3496789.1 unnamed protein product [Digitaria exilis]